MVCYGSETYDNDMPGMLAGLTTTTCSLPSTGSTSSELLWTVWTAPSVREAGISLWEQFRVNTSGDSIGGTCTSISAHVTWYSELVTRRGPMARAWSWNSTIANWTTEIGVFEAETCGLICRDSPHGLIDSIGQFSFELTVLGAFCLQHRNVFTSFPWMWFLSGCRHLSGSSSTLRENLVVITNPLSETKRMTWLIESSPSKSRGKDYLRPYLWPNLALSINWSMIFHGDDVGISKHGNHSYTKERFSVFSQPEKLHTGAASIGFTFTDLQKYKECLSWFP